MFILEDPYVSGFLAHAVIASGAPVLDTPMARRALGDDSPRLLGDADFAAAYRAGGGRIYANSENAIGWIAEHLADTPLPGHIATFKDKVRFRELIADRYPDYRFAAVEFADLDSFDPATVPAPFVIKPAVGFFSLGVHVVQSVDDWPAVLRRIQAEVAEQAIHYPEQVVALDRFIVEQVIEGDEYAFDAFFDADGRPHVVNILGHLFAGETDVGDRVYYTSAELIDRFRAPFEAFLEDLARREDLRDFPVHVEVRIDAQGRLAPIEVNPMRFAGWCVADLAHHAYGFDPYECYLTGSAPDWDSVLPPVADQVTAMVIADVPAGIDRTEIESVDYEGFSARFGNVLELRRIDYVRHPVFAFLFARMPADDLSELHDVLTADFGEYLELEESSR